MSAKAAGEYLDLKPKTLLSLAARGRIPQQGILRLGRQLRFNVAVIETEIQKGRRGPVSGPVPNRGDPVRPFDKGTHERAKT